ncbi:hypothetical protein ACFE04_004580 [Oxalis oulophora]
MDSNMENLDGHEYLNNIGVEGHVNGDQYEEHMAKDAEINVDGGNGHKKRSTSVVWDYFDYVGMEVDEDNEKRPKAKCKGCGDKLVGGGSSYDGDDEDQLGSRPYPHLL